MGETVVIDHIDIDRLARALDAYPGVEITGPLELPVPEHEFLVDDRLHDFRAVAAVIAKAYEDER